MATKFIKGDVVQVASVLPKGPVEKLRMDEDGNFFYLISWLDAEGKTQQRWFAEPELTTA
jgi:uncharacterized protein YodC (DUF2158 family)